MDIFFSDPSEIPLPPDEVRIRRINFDLSEDHRRLRIQLELDPFQKRPNLELQLLAPSGKEASRADIIETMSRKMELILHLRIDPQPGEYRLNAVLYYTNLPSDADQEPASIERQVIDQAFEIIMIE